MARFNDMGTRSDLLNVDPKLITVEPNHNPRDYSLPENREHLDNLKASIQAQGVLQPLWVRWDKDTIILVDGECRLRAVQELIAAGVEIKSIPTKLVKAGNEIERALLALTANAGKPLSKWEAGTKYRQLEGWGWSHKAIAERVAQSERYVREAIELADAPQQVKEMLSSGQVTPRVALKTVRENGTASVAVLQQKIEVAGGAVVKAERVTKEAEFIKIANAIYLDCKADFEENERLNAGERFEHISVRAGLLKKLFALL